MAREYPGDVVQVDIRKLGRVRNMAAAGSGNGYKRSPSPHLAEVTSRLRTLLCGQNP